MEELSCENGTQMNLLLNELKTVALRVAERLWVSCPKSVPRPGREEEITCEQDCQGECEGTGKVWPLRRKCPAIEQVGINIAECGNERHNSYTYNRLADHSECQVCKGRDWTPITDRDTIEEAVRAKGWVVNHQSNGEHNGDWVRINDSIVKGSELIAACESRLGLRSTLAIYVAVDRTLDKIAN